MNFSHEKELIKLISKPYKRADLENLKSEITSLESQGLVLLNLLKNRQNLEAKKLWD